MRKCGLYLALGDSTTHRSPSNSKPYGAYPNQLAAWIRQNYGPVQLLNKGVGGWTSSQFINSFSYVGAFSDADLITIGFGINDKTGPAVTVAQFKINLQTAIDRFRKANPNVIIILCTSNTLTDTTNDTATTPYRTAMDEVAAGYSSGVYVAHFETAWTPAQGGANTGDGIHPNDSGHVLLFNIVKTVVQTNASNWLNSLGK